MLSPLPFNISKHLRVPKELPEVDVEHVTRPCHHDVVIVPVTDSEDVGSHTVPSAGVREVLNSLQIK